MTTPTRFSRLEELYHQLVDLDEEIRAPLLEAARRSDPELVGELERLLRREAASVGETLIDLPGVQQPQAGDRVGPYLLVRQLGEGGMGMVFEAEQEAPVQRRVALKLVRPELWGITAIARFARERQALALMSHPGIARVYDAGATADGRPYVAMELVEGEGITTALDRRGATVRQRLELLVKVFRAVQHAHQKGILHRDLKPSNVLAVEEDGELAPTIIDFGIAKAIDDRHEEVAYTGPETEEATRADLLRDLGLLLSDRGRHDEAVAMLEQAVEATRAAMGDTHSEVAEALNDLAWALTQTRDNRRALALHHEALAILEAVYPPDHPTVTVARAGLAGTLRELGRDDEAVAVLEQALASFRRTLGGEHPYVAHTLNNLALAVEHQGDFARAVELYSEATEHYARLYGEDHPQLAIARYNLARALRLYGDSVAAERECRASLRIRRGQLRPDHPDIARNLTLLAELRRDEHDPAGALPFLRQALDLRLEGLPETHPLTARSLYLLGLTEMELDLDEEAEAHLLDSRRLYLFLAEETPRPTVRTSSASRSPWTSSHGARRVPSIPESPETAGACATEPDQAPVARRSASQVRAKRQSRITVGSEICSKRATSLTSAPHSTRRRTTSALRASRVSRAASASLKVPISPSWLGTGAA
jgi:tetratricopeptide (TPR) repeat protein